MPNGEAVRDDDVRELLNEIETLKTALDSYTSCKHGEVSCNCSDRARAVLWRYVKQETRSSKILKALKK